MEDADAEFTVGIDVWVVQWAVELERGRRVWVVVWEGHDGFEVAAIVEGVGVQDHESYRPSLDGLIDKLKDVSALSVASDSRVRITSTLTHFS